MRLPAKIAIAVSAVSLFAFALGFYVCGMYGFIAGAIVGEGPEIAVEHAARNRLVFGVIGGAWAAFLAGRFVFCRLRKDRTNSGRKE